MKQLPAHLGIFVAQWRGPVHYKVDMHITDVQQGHPVYNRLQYQVTLQFQEIREQELIFRCERRQHRINSQEPDNYFDKIAVDTAAVLNPTLLRISQSGEVRGVVNFPDIRKKWEAMVTAVKTIYKGDTVNDYLDAMETRLADETIFFQSLQRDLFYKLYFNQLYGPVKKIQETVYPLRLYEMADRDVIDIPVRKTIGILPEDPQLLQLHVNGEDAAGYRFSGEYHMAPESGRIQFAGLHIMIADRGTLRHKTSMIITT